MLLLLHRRSWLGWLSRLLLLLHGRSWLGRLTRLLLLLLWPGIFLDSWSLLLFVRSRLGLGTRLGLRLWPGLSWSRWSRVGWRSWRPRAWNDQLFSINQNHDVEDFSGNLDTTGSSVKIRPFIFLRRSQEARKQNVENGVNIVCLNLFRDS